MTVRPLVSLLAVAAVSLVACSGGGGGGGGTTTPPFTPTPTPSPTPTGSTTCTSGFASIAGLRRAPRAGATGVVPDRLFVTYRSGTRSPSSVEQTVGAVRSIDVGRMADGLIHRAITIPPGSDANTVAAALRKDASVVRVDPVHYRYLALNASANDPDLQNTDQWYLFKTNVDSAAWSGTPSLPTGANAVTVAVIDTGVDETNQDFVFDVKESVINGVKATGNGTVKDTDGHGTNTSGLATAQTNNAYGFAGVGYATHLQAYKIFPDATSTNPCPTASTADEVTAINDAVANGASVISLSLGSPSTQGADPNEQAAIAAAISAGVTVVAAAGNEYPTSDGQAPDYPAGYPNVIAVGASAVGNHTANNYASISSEKVASYSNSGPTLVAPGGDAGSDTGTDKLVWIEGYGTRTPQNQSVSCSDKTLTGVCALLFNGTSQATPQVAGAVALMEAKAGGKRSMTPAAVKAILTSTAVNIGDTVTRQGAGRLDTGAAVTAAP